VSWQQGTRSLLEDLRRPEAYPGLRPSRVTLITTHISWVFLTDREAWKLQRLVDCGFVNYATLTQRRSCCEDEVRLNRLAPDVYLGVVRSAWSVWPLVRPRAVGAARPMLPFRLERSDER